MRRRHVWVALLLALGLHGVDLQAQEPAVTMTYYAAGRNAEGGGYTAVVEVTRDGDRVTLVWTFPAPPGAIPLVAQGYGFVFGDLWVVTFVMDQRPPPGVILYRALGNGTLEGQWILGDTPILRETLSPTPQSAPAGVEIRG